MSIHKSVDSCYLVHQTSDGKYVIYNVERHIPIIVDKTGKSFFDIICNNTKIESCKKVLSSKEFDEFVIFLKDLANVQILDNSAADKIVIKVKHPKTAYLHLTYNCNLHCNYCYNMDIRENFKDLPFNKWEKILNKILPTTDYFILTGGEPFLYKDLLKIIEYIKSYNSACKIEILSNGMTRFSTKKDINDIFNSIHRATFSCDNFDENNQLRKGFNIKTFKKNIEWLIEQGYSSKIALSSVYFNNNLNGTEQVKMYCKGNCLQHRRVLVIPNNRNEIEMMPSLESFIDSLQTDDTIYDYTTFFKRLNCGAGVGIVSIDPQGNCFPCQNLHYPQFNCGNIITNSYNEILHSKVLKMFRSALLVDNIDKCQDCKLRYFCGGGCRAASYRLEGKINAFPEVMCSYYKTLSLQKLLNGAFFTPKQLLLQKNKINDIIRSEFTI